MKATFDVPASKVEADVSTLSTNVGTLSSLTTTAKSSLVAAVNELDSDIGTLSGNITKNGYMNWSQTSVASGNWITNTGYNNSSGYKPSGGVQNDSYNLLLDLAGTYLVTFHCRFQDSMNKTGLR